MNHLRVHLVNYLKLRRGLGFKLDSTETLLRSFVLFAETKKALAYLATYPSPYIGARMKTEQHHQKERRPNPYYKELFPHK